MNTMMRNGRSQHTCPWGEKCCDYDGRGKKQKRRTIRTREKAAFEKSLRKGEV